MFLLAKYLTTSSRFRQPTPVVGLHEVASSTRIPREVSQSQSRENESLTRYAGCSEARYGAGYERANDDLKNSLERKSREIFKDARVLVRKTKAHSKSAETTFANVAFLLGHIPPRMPS